MLSPSWEQVGRVVADEVTEVAKSPRQMHLYTIRNILTSTFSEKGSHWRVDIILRLKEI